MAQPARRAKRLPETIINTFFMKAPGGKLKGRIQPIR
jgi:hypothetical protein